MITVFTPTYNRKKELENLYHSLVNQKGSDFEWLIIDDGSKDNTKETVEKWKQEGKITIRYQYKENGGKQSAYNQGLEEAKGDIFLTIDSDDILVEDILPVIEKDFKTIEDNSQIAGIAYMQSYIKDKEKIIGTNFPEDEMVARYFDIYHKLKVTGDKLIVLKTKIAKDYPFPMIEGERFIAEALVFNRISLQYQLLCKNTIAASKEYLEDGYSNHYFELVKKNPKGNMLYFKELYGLEKSFYHIYGYLLFGIYGKIKFGSLLKEHPAKIRIILLYLPTLFIAKIKDQKED